MSQLYMSSVFGIQCMYHIQSKLSSHQIQTIRDSMAEIPDSQPLPDAPKDPRLFMWGQLQVCAQVCQRFHFDLNSFVPALISFDISSVLPPLCFMNQKLPPLHVPCPQDAEEARKQYQGVASGPLGFMKIHQLEEAPAYVIDILDRDFFLRSRCCIFWEKWIIQFSVGCAALIPGCHRPMIGDLRMMETMPRCLDPNATLPFSTYIYIYTGGFLKWGYLKIVHVNKISCINHAFGCTYMDENPTNFYRYICRNLFADKLCISISTDLYLYIHP